MPNILQSVSDDLSSRPRSQWPSTLEEAKAALPEDQREAFRQAFGGPLPAPEPPTRDAVWLIIIWFFAIVMFLAAVTLCIGVYLVPTGSGTKPEVILTIFTTVTAFLGGLFAPSPVNKKDGG